MGPRTVRGAADDPSRARRRRTLARLLGASGMLLLTVALFWLLTDESFRVDEGDVRVVGAQYAEEDAVLAHLSGIARRPNVFRVRATDLVADMQALPQVSEADAVVTLPATISVRLSEREPIFAWSDGRRAWLVDADGVLFAAAPPTAGDSGPDTAESAPDEAEGTDDGEGTDVGSTDAAGAAAPPTGAATDIEEAMDEVPGYGTGPDDGLPVVEDHRLPSEPLAVGSRLSAIDLAVMRQLLAVTPELLGSGSGALQLSVDQLDGYVLRSDLGWQAVFGHYTPTLQPPEDVPAQVQCLEWLLARRERRLERVRLAVSDSGCGTFTRTGSAG